MAEPLVSVVTPSLDQGRWIDDAIRSVLGQAHPRIEYLVMDGGSTDGTLDVLRGYGSRLAWSSGRDGGQAQALATGFARTRGDILAWLNADDVYAPDAIARAVAAFAAEPDVALVFGNAEFMDAAGRPLGQAEHVLPLERGEPLLRLGDCVVQPAAFFRRSAYEAVGGLDPALHWTMDYDLWFRLARRFPTRRLDATLARVRCTPGTKTASGGWKRIAEVERVARRHGAAGLPSWFALEAAVMHAEEALAAAKHAQLGSAAAALGAAVRRLGAPGAVGALASARTWRIARQLCRNRGW